MRTAIAERQSGPDEHAFIKEAAAAVVRAGGEAALAHSAKGVLSGAIEVSLATHGIRASEAAEAAAIGVLEAAGDFGEAAVEQAKRIVTRPIAGITPLHSSYFATGRRTP